MNYLILIWHIIYTIYYFDTGVKNRLAKLTNIPTQSDLYGQAFEHFIAMELRAYISYTRQKYMLHFWRTTEGYEVDFVINNSVAVEVQTSSKISTKHMKGLKRLMDEEKMESYYLVSHDPIARKEQGVNILPWETFLKKLWDGDVI